jgi:hypothetical protein
MKTKRNILTLSIVVVMVLYVAGYFFEVHQRLRNPFISWPIMRPLPMETYYRVSSLRVIYEPVVRLDQKLFPTRWFCQPTPKEQYEILIKTIDLNHIHQMSMPPNKSPEPAAVGAGSSAIAVHVARMAWLSFLR